MATTISGGLAPIYGSNGLITGYRGQKNAGAGYQSPVKDSSGLISGYTGNAEPGNSAAAVNPNDPAGKHEFDPVTGLNKQGKTRGQQAAEDYQQSTGLVSTVKSEPIAQAAATTLGQEQQLANTTVKSFGDYLNEAKQLQEQGAQQVAQDTKTLNAAPAKLESSLSQAVKDFAGATGALDQKVTDLNAANEKTVSGNIAQLGTLNDQYDAAARAVAERAVANAQARSNAAQSATGTPNTDSGYWDAQSARITSDIMLPVEQQISQNRISQLTNYVTPQQQQLYANRLSQVTGLEMPVASALVQYGISNANQVAQLQAALAGRSLSEQIQYLSSLGLPISVAQSVAQSLPQAIGALSAIDQNNTYYGLAQDYQQPINGALPTYNLPAPTFTNGYQPPGGTVNPYTGTNTPLYQPLPALPPGYGPAAAAPARNRLTTPPAPAPTVPAYQPYSYNPLENVPYQAAPAGLGDFYY